MTESDENSEHYNRAVNIDTYRQCEYFDFYDINTNQYTYVCHQCEYHGGGKCTLTVEQDGGPPAETPLLCNWAYSIDDSKAIWIPQFPHDPEFYICVKNHPEILISSAYLTKEAAQKFIDEWCLHNCDVTEL